MHLRRPSSKLSNLKHDHWTDRKEKSRSAVPAAVLRLSRITKLLTLTLVGQLYECQPKYHHLFQLINISHQQPPGLSCLYTVALALLFVLLNPTMI